MQKLGADGEGTASAGTAQIRKKGRSLVVQIPRAAVGAAADGFTLRFKVSDHVVEYKDILNYYVQGDAAPIGRFNYTVKG